MVQETEEGAGGRGQSAGCARLCALSLMLELVHASGRRISETLPPVPFANAMRHTAIRWADQRGKEEYGE